MNMNFFSLRNPVKQIKTQTINQGKRFANHASNKGLVSRVYKEISKFHSKTKQNPRDPIKTWAAKDIK